LNVHAPTGDKIGDVKYIFYEELERIFDKFPEYHMKNMLGDFKAKIGRKDIFKPTIGNGSLNENSNDYGVGVVNFAKSKNQTVRCTMFPNRNINKFTWTSPDGKNHNQLDHIVIDKRRQSSVLDVRSFRAAGCDTGHYLVVAKFMEKLEVIIETRQSFHMEMWVCRC
jgi:hypothetical protein